MKKYTDVFICVGLALSFFLIYAFNACPGVYPDDSGETISAAYFLGIAHPPGYPLISLIGKLFTYLPMGSVAYRVNLCAAFLGGLALALAYLFFRLTCREFTHERHVERVGALFGALCLGLCPIFWHQALVAKGGIYLLNLCLILTCLIALMRWSRESSAKAPYLFFASAGLGLANHHMSIVMFAPGLLVFAYFHREQ